MGNIYNDGAKMTTQQLLSPLRRAVDTFNMIDEGDRIAVGLSGGKDSVTLLTLLAKLRLFYPNKFSVVAITIDMGLDYDEKEILAMKDYCKSLNVEYVIEKTDIGPILFDIRKEKNPCSLCSKMRRGALNTVAKKLGCNKLALGHHADDLVETFFLSMIFEGRFSTFEPVTYLSRSEVTVIRPMIYIEEKDIAAFANKNPVIHNPCPADKHTKRQYVKELIASIKKDVPFAKDRMLSAIYHPERNHLFGEALAKMKEFKKENDGNFIAPLNDNDDISVRSLNNNDISACSLNNNDENTATKR